MTDQDHISVDYYQAFGRLIGTYRMHRRLTERYVRSTGLHPTAHRMLMYLSLEGHLDRQKELADRFEITPAAVVQTLDKLEKDGYVERGASESDSRCKEIRITEKGLLLVTASREAFQAIDEKVFSGISDDEVQMLYRILGRMQENISTEFRKES